MSERFVAARLPEREPILKNPWHGCRSEDVDVVLWREATEDGSPKSEIAAGLLEEAAA